ADAEALANRAIEAADRAGQVGLAGTAYLARGVARQDKSEFQLAVEDFQAALAAARRAGDRRLEMHALRWLGGHSPIGLGTPIGECTDRLREGLRVAESLGDRAAEADFLGWLAIIATN